jgi:hypothetical protein
MEVVGREPVGSSIEEVERRQTKTLGKERAVSATAVFQERMTAPARPGPSVNGS